MKSQRIAIVSTKQPGTNPRMRKNADALSAAGYTVHVLYGFSARWADETDQTLFKNTTWRHQRLGGHPSHSPISYFLYRLLSRFAAVMGWTDLEYCPAKNAYIRQLRQIKPNLVIGHNPSALPILSRWSQKHNGKVLFDAEDFHSGEGQEGARSNAKVAKLEAKHLQQIPHITAASPMIGKAYVETHPHLEATTLNNAFDQRLQPDFKPNPEGPLTLVWFSQVIGLDRGLEEFLTALHALAAMPIRITLIGLSTIEVKDTLQSMIRSPLHALEFKEPVLEPILVDILSKHMIGLALETGGTINRKLCLTNKLFLYPLAGCYTLASDTPAQRDFFHSNADLGTVLDLDSTSQWAQTITALNEDRSKLEEKRKKAWEIGHASLNWEEESQSLVETVQSMLAS